MDKYCGNCGKKLKEDADVCLNCGKFVNKCSVKENRSYFLYEILSIVGMVLGIISFILIFLLAFGIEDGRLELLYEPFFVRIMCSVFYTSIPLVLGIPSLVMSIVGVKNKKNVYGIIGLITSLISLVFCMWVIIYITI